MVAASTDMIYGDERVVFIEYHDGEPHMVITETIGSRFGGGNYDFDLTPKGLYYHNSGGGGAYAHRLLDGDRVQFWAADGVEITDGGSSVRRVLTENELREFGYDRLPAPLNGNPFHDGMEGRTTWCTVCEERVPEDDPCRHLVVLDDGTEAGCGSAETKADEHKEAVFLLLSCFPAVLVLELRQSFERALTYDKRRLRRRDTGGEIIDTRWRAPYRFSTFGSMLGPDTLEVSTMRRGLTFIDASDVDDLDEDDVRLGAAWFLSLSTGLSMNCPDTKSADAITLGWIEEFIASNPHALRKRQAA